MKVDEQRLERCVTRALRLGNGEFRADLSIGDVEQWDSVAHLELISEIEREFGVSFGLDDLTELTSLPMIRRRLESA